MTCRPIVPLSCLALLVGLSTGAFAYVPGADPLLDRSAARVAQGVAEPHARPIRVAQAGDVIVRINQLEEEIRRLNGRVEELSFQLLQAQEDMRKRQEDNEFRFQELEKGGERRGDVAPSADGSAPVRTAGRDDRSTVSAPAADRSQTSAASDGDGIGRILEGGEQLGSSTAPAGDGAAPTQSSTVAAVTPQGAADMYALAYNYLLAGDYQLAEQSFRQYAQTYPNAADTPDAEYWLGESLFQQQKYADAAETFLDAQKSYPENAKAPEMMLKLGMSLAKLENRETACVTFKEVARRYPQMTATVKSKLAGEEKAANC